MAGVRPTGGRGATVADHYDRFRRAAGTHRARLVVRLAGEVGLRPAEMCRLRPADVTARVAGGNVHYLLTVRDDDGRECRAAYLPGEVKRELERYARSRGIDEEEPVFDVSARRLQMLVSEVAESVAEETDREALATVSTADLRRRFGRRRLEEGVDPSVVMGVGGWRRLEGLAPDGPTDDRQAVVEAFDRAGEGGNDRFRAAFERLEHAVVLLDADGVVENVNREFEAVTGLPEEAVEGRPAAELLGLSERERTEMWETTHTGNTWVGETAWRPTGEEPVRGQSTLTAVDTEDGSASGFLLTFRPEGTTVRARGPDRERLQRVQAASSRVSEAVADAATREEVLDRACERLAASPAFEFAWGSEASPDGPATPVAWTGIDETTLERLAVPRAGDGRRLADRAIEDGAVRTAPVDGDGEAGGDGRADGESDWLVAVPLVHGESVDGALVLGTPRSPGQAERGVLASLGERVAGALAATEWKRLLLADTVLELEFQSDDRDSFFVAASAEMECELRMEGLVPLGGESLLYYVTVDGVPPDRALATASETLDSARLIADHRDECLLEVTTSGASLAGTLIEQGANVSELTAERGRATLVCETTPTAPVRAIAEHVGESSPSATLVAKREVESPVRTPTEYQRSLGERLTEKQRSVLQAAYHAGYFDWPRGSTAEELADSIGVSSPTLHNHLRRGQRKLLSAFFDEE